MHVELADDIIAVADPAPRAPLTNPSFEPSPGLLGEVFQEERVHRALEADMKLAPLALGERQHRHAAKLRLFVQGGDVFLVARQLVERPGDDDVERIVARVLEQLLIARPHADGAANCGVGIGRRQRPALRVDSGLAEAHLILDRGIALQIGRMGA